MRKQSSFPKNAKAPRMPRGNDEGGRFVDRNLVRVSPAREQFEPTAAEPVRQKFKMAGGC
jgi:hypothetical protein